MRKNELPWYAVHVIDEVERRAARLPGDIYQGLARKLAKKRRLTPGQGIVFDMIQADVLRDPLTLHYIMDRAAGLRRLPAWIKWPILLHISTCHACRVHPHRKLKLEPFR